MNEDTGSGLTEIESLVLRATSLTLSGTHDALIRAVIDVIKRRSGTLADVEAKLALALALLGDEADGARPETVAVLRNAAMDLARIRISRSAPGRELG